MFLHKVVKEKDHKMEELVSCLADMLPALDLIKIHQKMKEPWNLEEMYISSIPPSQEFDNKS
jgi:hypothetical protein